MAMTLDSNRRTTFADRVPPHVFFMVSAVFHYLGPSFAVLLFAFVDPLGVAWLRIASAALIFALWKRPWRFLIRADRPTLWLIMALGATLATMNAVFYLAIDRLPLATVAAIEFVATIVVALAGMRTLRNLCSLIMTLCGVYLLLGFEGGTDGLGLLFAILNAALFALYIVLGHAVARTGAVRGVDALASAMLVAAALALPFGIMDAAPAFGSASLLFAALGVGVASSVIPYVCDQLAMARLPRATFALMLALLPATAAVVGAVVLRQLPSAIELAGILVVALGIAVHKPSV